MAHGAGRHSDFIKMQLPNINAIARRYDHVIISPHFDDAAASCGGRIIDRAKMGEKVLIVTVFTSHITKEKSFRKKAYLKLFDYDRRCAEDKAAMASLGVDFIWLGYREILFRENIPLFRYWPNFRKTRSNVTLSDGLASDLLDICRKTGCKNLILPLAVGQHMDHQIVFQAGVDLLKSGERSFSVIFYEDCPYVLFPHMLCYRMKITGGYHHLLHHKEERLKHSYPSALRDAVDLLSGSPAFKFTSFFLRSVSLLFILVFGFYTQHVLRVGKSRICDGLFISQEFYDISHIIERKLDAVMAYRSQLIRPVLKRKRIRGALASYSEFIGMPKHKFCERYWKIETD
jgi:LmbE family N-acetylglucosaminyl deacetylase